MQGFVVLGFDCSLFYRICGLAAEVFGVVL